MSIDWSKMMDKPDSLYKIRGKFLLDLRAKINELEKNWAQKKNEISILNDNLTSTINDFEGKLKKAIDESKENKIKLDGSNEKIVFLERTLLNKEKEIKGVQADIAENIKNYIQKIQNKDSEIKRLSNEIEMKNIELKEKIKKKDIEIEKIQKEAEGKTKEINDLIKKFKELEVRLSDRIILSSKLIKKIEKLMVHKGFINDKEFEALKRKLIERQIPTNS